MGPHLDINTPRGQVTLADEQKAAALFERRYPESKYCKTPKEGIASVDAVICKADRIVGVTETKCRYHLTLAAFRQTFNSEWLVTWEKIMDGAKAAGYLQVPFWGFLYLVDDNILLFKKLWCPQRGWVAALNVRRTPTQATVNGGEALRYNSYIDMRIAEVIQGPR